MQFELTVAAPAVAALIWALLAILAAPGESRVLPRVCGTLAVGFGFATAWFLVPWAPMAPDPDNPAAWETWHWLLYGAAAAAAVGLVEVIPGLPKPVAFILRANVVVGLAWVLVPSGPGWEDFAAHWRWWVLAIGESSLVLWCLLDPLFERRASRFLPWMLVLVIAGAVFLLERFDFGKLLELGLALGAATAVVAVLNTLRPSAALVQGMIPVVAVLLPGLLFSARFHSFNDVPMASVVLVLVSPLTLWITEAGEISRWHPARRGLVALVFLAVPIGIAVALAVFGVDPSRP